MSESKEEKARRASLVETVAEKIRALEERAESAEADAAGLRKEIAALEDENALYRDRVLHPEPEVMTTLKEENARLKTELGRREISIEALSAENHSLRDEMSRRRSDYLNLEGRAYCAKMDAEEKVKAVEKENATLRAKLRDFEICLTRERDKIAALEKEIERLCSALDAKTAADDPDLDATDGAHPAWWRGQEHGARKVGEQAAKIIIWYQAGASSKCDGQCGSSPGAGCVPADAVAFVKKFKPPTVPCLAGPGCPICARNK